MTKELNEILIKFNTQPDPADYQILFNFISNETELTSKIYKVLESLQNKLLKTQSDINDNSNLFKFNFCELLVLKNKNLFDFIQSWMINLYYKIEENEKIILDIFLFNIVNNSFAKIDLIKKINIEENYFYKLMKRHNSFESLQKICYVQDCLEKKSGGGEKTKEKLIKNKNKKLLEYLVNYYGRDVIDFYMIMICFKIKCFPNKIEIENEKWNLKISSKYFPHIQDYIFEILLSIFNPSNPSNLRKFILFVILISIKNFGLKFLDNLFQLIYGKLNSLNNTEEVFSFFKNLDFTILNENFTHIYQNIDTTLGFAKTTENLLYDMVGTHNMKLDNIEALEINETKILTKLNTLKIFILLIESFINQILIQGFTNVNIVAIYTFYHSLQLKFIKNFVIFPDTQKKKYYENQVNIGNITKIMSKYNKKYAELNSILSEIISLLYNINGASLIFQNWLIFLYKNGTILDAYKALRIFLITKKEGGQIYTLLKMHHEISKFYSSLWRIVLDSFLINCSNRNSEENFNLITNLKFIFYYESSLKSKSLSSKSLFYDTTSYECNVVLKFFKEKISVLTSIFFSDENIIEKIQSEEKLDMDICFETYIKQNKNNSSPLFEINEIEKIHTKTKIEILNIISFLFNTYEDTDVVSFEVTKFVLDLIDLLVERRDSQVILDHVLNILKIIMKIYIKNSNNSQIVSAPIKIIFINLVKHILNKTINGNNPHSNIYFEIFKEIHSTLINNNLNSNLSNLIIFTLKELIHKNVDNQSFKNPYSM